jgi:hypothetical protein
LKGAFGDDVAGWATKVIVMFRIIADNGLPGLRVRILPPKQAAAAEPPKPASSSGNGAATAPPAQAKAVPRADDAELEPDPAKTHDEEMDDEIPF